jgi:hypothetical protein
MSSKRLSAINGKTLDINHLEREIQADVATYRQFKAEDGMKKRAIHTSKSKGYVFLDFTNDSLHADRHRIPHSS